MNQIELLDQIGHELGWLPPEKGSSHWKFYEHIKAGGRVWRDDPLNNVKQWVTLEMLGGDAAKICMFGYADLSIKDEAPNPTAKRRRSRPLERPVRPVTTTTKGTP